MGKKEIPHRTLQLGVCWRELDARSCEKRRADALEFLDAVHASAVVEAVPCGALVDFLAAVFPGETGLGSAN